MKNNSLGLGTTISNEVRACTDRLCLLIRIVSLNRVKTCGMIIGAIVNLQDNWIAHQDDFNQLLADLNSCHGQNSPEGNACLLINGSSTSAS